MNRISLQLVLGLLLCITTSYATITREGARDFVLNQIVTDRIGNVNVLLSDELIAANTNVSGMGHTVLTPYSSNWVAFIDEAPAFGGRMRVHMYLLILNPVNIKYIWINILLGMLMVLIVFPLLTLIQIRI